MQFEEKYLQNVLNKFSKLVRMTKTNTKPVGMPLKYNKCVLHDNQLPVNC